MSGPLSTAIDRFDPTTLPVQEAEPVETGFLDNLRAGFEITRRRDIPLAQVRNLSEDYAPLVEAVNRGRPWYQRIANPGQMFDRERGEADLFAEIRRRREVDPTFLAGAPASAAELRAASARRVRGIVERNEQVGARANGWGMVGNLAGSIGGQLTDPGQAALAFVNPGGAGIRQIAARGAVLGVAAEAASQPAIASNTRAIGQDYGLEDAARNILVGAAAGAVLEPMGEVVGRAVRAAPRLDAALERGTDSVVARVFEIMPERVQQAWLARGDAPDAALPALADAAIGRDRLSPTERAAAAVIERADEVEAVSPFPPASPDAETHGSRLAMAVGTLLARGDRIDPAPAGSLPMPMAPPVRGTASATFMASVRRVESGGNDQAAARTSSAFGRYQFTRATWLGVYRNRFGRTGESDAAILAKRADGALQDVLMRDLTDGNARMLERAGLPVTPGTLYLTHFLGPRATAVLRVSPETPVARLLPPEFVTANPRVLSGRSAGEVVRWAATKTGDQAPMPVAAVDQPIGAAAAPDPLPAPEPIVAAAEPIDVPDFPESVAPPPPADSLSDSVMALIPRVAAAAAEDGVSLVPARLARRLGADEGDVAVALARVAADPGSRLMVTRTGKIRRALTRREPVDAITFLADRGGIRDDEGHALVRRRNLPKMVSGAGPLIRQDGMSIDSAGELLHEAGYFGPPTTTERPTPAEVLEVLESTHRGDRRFSVFDTDDVVDAQLAAREDDEGVFAAIDGRVTARGLNLSADEIGRVSAAMRDGTDMDDAIDDLVAFEIEQAVRAMHLETDAEDYAIFDELLEEGYGGGPQDRGIDEGGGRSPADPGDARAGGSGVEERPGAAAGGAGEDALGRFDTPGNADWRAQVDSIEHDVRMAAAGGFRLDDADEREAAEILKALDDEAAEIETLRGCLKPGGAA